MRVSREHLYEEIWSEPMTTVAKRYDVSSNYLARVCERLHIPRPTRGYWAQRASGADVVLPDLPDASPRDDIEWARGEYPRRMQLPPPKAPDVTNVLTPRDPFQRPARHPLVASNREYFQEAEAGADGYLRTSDRAHIDLVVSKECLRKALRLMNELFLALEDRHHRVEVVPHGVSLRRADLDERENTRPFRQPPRWKQGRTTAVFIGTVAIGITVFEMSENVEVRPEGGALVRVAAKRSRPRHARDLIREWTTYRDLPSGRLCVRAGVGLRGAPPFTGVTEGWYGEVYFAEDIFIRVRIATVF